MKKLISLFSVTLLVGLSLSLSVQAQPGPLISDIREQLNGVLVQLRTIDNECIVVLSGLVQEVDAGVLETRKLITADKGNLGTLAQDALLDAHDLLINSANSVANHCLDLLDILLVEIGGEDGDVEDPIYDGGLVDVFINLSESNGGTVDDRKSNKIVSLFRTAVFQVDTIHDLIDGGGSLARDAHAILDHVIFEILENKSVTPCLDTGTNPSRWVRTSPVVPQMTETGPISFAALRQAKILLGQAHTFLKRILRLLQQAVRIKKWVFKAFNEVKELLRASNFGGRAASDLLITTESATNVYTLNGALVVTHSDGLDVSRLANGVYLAMTGNKVRKVAVNR